MNRARAANLGKLGVWAPRFFRRPPGGLHEIHSGHFYSAPSSPLLLRGAPDYSTDTVSKVSRLKYHLGRFASLTGSERTLKDWLTCMQVSGSSGTSVDQAEDPTRTTSKLR